VSHNVGAVDAELVEDGADVGLLDLSRLRLVVDTGTLLPYKTTAHEFEPVLPVVSIGLDSLLDGAIE
jgi:hypothetical protein